MGIGRLPLAISPREPRPEPEYVPSRQAACGYKKPTLEQCDELEDGVYCPLVIGTPGKKCKCAGRMRAFWKDPSSKCPLGKWAV